MHQTDRSAKKTRRIARLIGSGMAFILTCTAAPAFALTCDMVFDLVVDHGIGPYPPGTEMQVEAHFETLESFRQEGGATAHLTTGTMVLDGNITGRLWTVITTNRTHSADYVGIHAIDVEGLTFVGLEYQGPMTITLFADPGSWGEDRPPVTQEEWEHFDLYRAFQLHAQGQDRLGAEVVGLTADCRVDTTE